MEEGGFKYIEDYLIMSKNMHEQDSDMVWNLDQSVPQFVGSIEVDRIYFNTIVKSDETLNAFLDGSTNESSQGCTYVPEVTDQQVYRDEGTKNILDLDQIFYDTTQDIKPMISSSGDIIDTENLFSGNEENYQNIENWMVFQAKRDIDEESKNLNISCDPMLWSANDMNRWIDRTCTTYKLDKPSMESFQMTGACLCMLSEEQFMWKCPNAGSLLYNQLDIWKNACKLTDINPNIPKHNKVDDFSFDRYNHVYQCPSQSLSPSHSVESNDSSFSSSPSHSADDTCSKQNRQKINTVQQRVIHEHKHTIHLWQFLKELLNQAEKFGNCIKWLDQSKGIFKIDDSSRVAKEWGLRKNRPAMNYDKLSRSIRQYYRKGIIKKTELSKRLVYQFCAKYL